MCNAEVIWFGRVEKHMTVDPTTPNLHRSSLLATLLRMFGWLIAISSILLISARIVVMFRLGTSFLVGDYFGLVLLFCSGWIWIKSGKAFNDGRSFAALRMFIWGFVFVFAGILTAF